MTTWTEQNKTLVGDVDFLFSDGLDFLFSDSSDYVFVEGAVPTWTSASRSQVLLSGWTQVQKISINYAQVAGTLTNFPVYFDLSALGTSFFTHVNADGSDIRVTTSDGFTQVPVEVVAVDTGAETGQIHFLAPTLSDSVDTVFYIYYGNAAATMAAADSTYGSQAVWADYVGVWHLNESGATKGDSTGNSDGTATGTVTSIDGKIGKAAHFDATVNSRIFVPDAAGLTNFDTPDSFSISFWARRWSTNSLVDRSISEHWEQSAGIDPYPWGLRGFTSSTAIAMNLYNGGSGAPSGVSYNPGSGSVTGLADNTWGLFTFVRDRAALLMRTYLNATAKTTGTDTIPSGDSIKASANGFQIGERNSSSSVRTPNLDIQEFRVFDGVLSTTRISTEYANQNSPATFYTVSDLNWNANIKNSASWTSPAKA